MSIHVALHHQSRYRYDRAVGLSPHEVRLRPAPHCRTPIRSYSLTVAPGNHFVNWQQDVFGNYIARFVFPEATRTLEITVDLTADMTVINPFDFFIESYAERFPFPYRDDLARDLAPFLAVDERGPLLTKWIAESRSRGPAAAGIIDFLIALNRGVQRDVQYLVRMDPGVQSCEETLRLGSGSCRDSGWLLVQILRHFGLAARFVSGYLIQLTADLKPLDGPAGPERDFTDLHAWAEAYIPGAGWIGLDPTSGLMAGEGHIPLACTPAPGAAAPVTGSVDPCESRFDFAMSVTRVHEDPRVTRPHTTREWRQIERLGRQVDADLAAGDVRLTQGGEPTFVAVDDMDGPEWNTTALSPKKWEFAERLAWRLRERFAPAGLLLYGQGKWYPGEPLPRWALGIHWRADGKPVWRNAGLIAAGAGPGSANPDDALRFARGIAGALGFHERYLITAHEDPLLQLQVEGRLPVHVESPAALPAADADPAQLMGMPGRDGDEPAGFVLPLRARPSRRRSARMPLWETSPWPLKRKRLYLLGGDSPLGYRLPLDSLPEIVPGEVEPEIAVDPFEAHGELPDVHAAVSASSRRRSKPASRAIVRTALCVEVRGGRLYVFLPPLQRIEDFLALTAVVERVAGALALPVRIEGYPPPFDLRMKVLNVTPDPGVIEVNIHPAANWKELCTHTFVLYEEARRTRLGTEKFMLDGRHTGTGGGNHMTLGGPTPADSPLLRRPDLLQSLITYWQNHPALSYLFSGLFVGPTSQAPRVDEARDDNLYELEIAFQQLALQCRPGRKPPPPDLTDRLLRNLLVDVTGNTHRAEFCIDKLYAAAGPTGRLGVVEMRAFEMPPHPQMSLTQMLLLRALVAWFWKTPYAGALVRWGAQLHDRFMLPHFIAADLRDVLQDLAGAGYAFAPAWFAPFIEFRFPRYGVVVYNGIELELRQAIEPWNVLGEEISTGATARFVDSSVERLQVRVRGLTESRYLVACNGRALPLQPTGTPGEFVGGVRYRAWNPPSALHPTIGVHTPLVFDIVDTWGRGPKGSGGRSIGGCTYHVAHPGGRNYTTFPVNANEAEARRAARFWDHGHTPGPMTVRREPPNPNFPLTLDLRYRRERAR